MAITNLGWKKALGEIRPGMRVAMRIDLNTPWSKDKKELSSSWRLQAVVPGIRAVLQQGASVLLLSHFSRPPVGRIDERYSLKPFTPVLAQTLGIDEVPLIPNWIDGVSYRKGGAVLAENVRFEPGELKNDVELGRKMAGLCDFYIMDAFGVSHRRHSSVCSAVEQAKRASAGPLLESELRTLDNVIHQAERPLVVILGGSKVSTKLRLIERMLKLADFVIPGGGIANTLMLAKGYDIGASAYDDKDLGVGESLWEMASEHNCDILMPIDVVVATEFDCKAKAQVRSVSQVRAGEMILDVGEKTLDSYKKVIQGSKAVLWNGPLGVFEWEQFSYGTFEMARTLALGDALVVAGGGETLKVIDTLGLRLNFDYISTGGGAMMAFLEGANMLALNILQKRMSQ